MVAEGRQRIDKWLFFARVIKSRALGAKLAQSGRVRVNGNKIEQASYAVKPGDVLTLTLDRRILVYRVIDCGERRGPADEARRLYEDMSQQAEQSGERLPDAIEPLRDVDSQRPTKRQRRETDGA